MILSKEKSKSVLEDWAPVGDLIVVDGREIPKDGSFLPFKWGVELLNLKRYSAEINKIHASIGVDWFIDDSIIDKAINTVLKKETFKHDEFLEYLQFQKKLNDFFTIYKAVFHIQHSFDLKIDLFLLGVYYVNLDKGTLDDVVIDYDDIFDQFLSKVLTAEDVVKETMKIHLYYNDELESNPESLEEAKECPQNN